MRKPTLFPILFATVHAFATFHAAAAEPRVERAPYNHFSDRDENVIGATLAKRFETRLRLFRNSIGEAYLDKIASQLAARSQRPEIAYQVRVIDSNAVNAFSLPGGHIYVTAGLLEFIGNESELAAALGHEIGHVEARHVINRIARYGAVETLLEHTRSGNVGNELADRISSAVFGTVYTLFERAFDRDEEREADLLGFYTMGHAGWSPEGMIALCDRVQRGGPRYGPAEKILSSHPDPRERADRLRDEMTEVLLPKTLQEDSVEFQVMKRGLALVR